ncbi:MFS transporter [Mycobacterium talmoniae]|uniref:MFS transporter n=1 Tax=Mycobacterium talmoniae TaxID=1858794 RepID=A0A1S1NFD4_9MYCO|nr:MFS transporter [Mycobacterium talmoniae]OHV04377.1 MFS transporter [Mycobacterium talmoniae]
MSTATRPATANPWSALWAMVVGFFMILVDSTIVAVANPKIMTALDVGFDAVIWVTSAYLVSYAVPLLVAGRLGDRFGPKNLYLLGLAVFTAASLWCGLSGSIGMLIAARVVQGVGAALLTPQTLTMITRIFPPERRGVALSVWGATAGVATLVGPLAGGVLADALGWEWIFFVNVPIGVIGLALAARLIPVLPTHRHRFDLLGVALSGVGVFLVVFALQEGQSKHWQPWIWAVMVAGIGCMVMFGYWQAINRHEPLVPLRVFTDRDFSLSNLGVAVIGFASVALMFPVMFYAQGVCGLSPTRAALLTAPMPVANGLLAPLVGRIVDRSQPRPVVGFGFSMLAIALTWLSIEMTPTTPIWRLLLPFAALGIGMAFIWSPLSATATRTLAPELAGAGSGVFNATRQIGTVLGSAGMAAFMTGRLTADMPDLPNSGHPQWPGGQVLQLPEFLREPFAAAMSDSMLLPAFIALFGVIAALFLVGMVTAEPPPPARVAAFVDVDDVDDVEDLEDIEQRPAIFEGRTEVIPVIADYDADVEYPFDPPVAAPAGDDAPAPEDERDTDPLPVRPEYPPPTAADPWPGDPLESWPSLANDPVHDLKRNSAVEPIGFAHNGFHVDDEQRFRPLAELASSADPRDTRDDSLMFEDTDDLSATDDYGAHARTGPRWGRPHGAHAWPAEDHPGADDRPPDESSGGSARHRFPEQEPPHRHRHPGPDDAAGHGRHSFPDE